MEDTVISPSVRQDLPKPIQQILADVDERKKSSSKVDMWTPAVEAQFQRQVASLAGMYIDTDKMKKEQI